MALLVLIERNEKGRCRTACNSVLFELKQIATRQNHCLQMAMWGSPYSILSRVTQSLTNEDSSHSSTCWQTAMLLYGSDSFGHWIVSFCLVLNCVTCRTFFSAIIVTRRAWQCIEQKEPLMNQQQRNVFGPLLTTSDLSISIMMAVTFAS